MEREQEINTATLPQHLAIIMDGNGRWAKQKGFLRTIGHENGTKSVRDRKSTRLNSSHSH
jgi:undecaprenyl diphosphate synthase